MTLAAAAASRPVVVRTGAEERPATGATGRRPALGGTRSRREPADLVGVSGRHAPGRSRRSWSGPMRVAHESRDRVADRLAHPPHLAVAALVDRDAQHARARLGRPWPGRSGRRRARRRRAGGGSRRRCTVAAADRGQVLLVDAVAGVGDAVGQLAVVREQQQALGVGVEAADREHPRLVGHELDHGRAAVGVLGRGDDAGRLVQQVVDEPGLARRPVRRRPRPGRRRGRRGGRARRPRR